MTIRTLPMRFVQTVLLSSLIVIALAGCATKDVDETCGPVELGAAFISGDGNILHLSLIMESGRHWVDEEPSPFMGEKYEGKFIFRVRFQNGTYVDTTFASLGDDMPDFFFDSTNQEIFVADYNNDGQPDFNIVSWGNTRMNTCQLFTIPPSGKVERLHVAHPPPESGDLVVNRIDDGISTDEFKLTKEGFYFVVHWGPPNPLEDSVMFVDWDKREKVFRCREEKIPLR